MQINLACTFWIGIVAYMYFFNVYSAILDHWSADTPQLLTSMLRIYSYKLMLVLFMFEF